MLSCFKARLYLRSARLRVAPSSQRGGTQIRVNLLEQTRPTGNSPRETFGLKEPGISTHASQFVLWLFSIAPRKQPGQETVEDNDNWFSWHKRSNR